MEEITQSAPQPGPWLNSGAPDADPMPPRASYALFIPALLACTGALGWMLGNPLGMVMAGTVGTAVALFTLWDWIYREGPTRFSTLLGMALLLGYALGTMNTWLTLPRDSLTLSEIYGFHEGVLARGLSAVLMSAATLYFLGEMFEKPLFGRNFRFYFDDRTRTLIYLGALAMLAGYATHSMTFEGANSSGGNLSVFGSALMWCYPPFAALSVAALFTSRKGRERVLSTVSTAIYFLMFSVLGRRAAIYEVVLILLVLPLVGYRLRGFSVKKVVLLAALGAIVVVSGLTFMLLRIAGHSVGTSPIQHVTVAQRVEVAHKMVKAGGAYALAAQTSQSNFQTRTFILTFFASVLDASSRMPPALGKDAEGMFQLVIPSVIYPGKNKDFAEEELVDTQFGFSFGDQPNSILTAGATDFGFAGVLIYPLLLVLLYRLLYNFFAPRISVTLLMIISLALINVFLASENTLSGYFSSLRSTILFGVLIGVLLSLPSIRLRAAERVPD